MRDDILTLGYTKASCCEFMCEFMCELLRVAATVGCCGPMMVLRGVEIWTDWDDIHVVRCQMGGGDGSW